jgi:XTP/dITP diphosphohydrolase
MAAERCALRRIVVASGNAGKLREIRAIVAPIGIEVVPQSELGVTEAEEPHPTFIENALAKARHASRFTGLPALADDSGICVAALHGAPGVRSARYAGEPRSDERNNALLVERLAREADRRAHYYCVMVLVLHPDDPQPRIGEGEWHGEVILEPRGRGGFGYDPYFLLPAEGRTAAELDPARKNAISHRAIALERLFVQLRPADA